MGPQILLEDKVGDLNMPWSPWNPVQGCDFLLMLHVMYLSTSSQLKRNYLWLNQSY